jgi:hypothetical protein
MRSWWMRNDGRRWRMLFVSEPIPLPELHGWRLKLRLGRRLRPN